MRFTVYLLIFILLSFGIIGLLVWRNRTAAIAKHNKKILIATGTLQAVHLILYFTGGLNKIGEANIYISFGICAVLSIICLALSIWMLIPLSNNKHSLKYLCIFIALLQVAGTIIIFLLPEAGIPPLIGF